MLFVQGDSAEPDLRPATTDQAKKVYQSPQLLKLSRAMLHQADSDNVPIMLMEDKGLLGSCKAPKLLRGNAVLNWDFEASWSTASPPLRVHLGGVLSIGCQLNGRLQGKDIACESLFEVNCSQISPEIAGRKALDTRNVVEDTEPFTSRNVSHRA
jgi:hypothetical protein